MDNESERNYLILLHTITGIVTLLKVTYHFSKRNNRGHCVAEFIRPATSN
jgi:hypothetical protein